MKTKKVKENKEKCLECRKKLPEHYIEISNVGKRFCSMKCLEKYYDEWEQMIHKSKALEARKKRAKLEGESVEYITPPKNNGLVREKNESFWSKFKKVINIRP